MCIIFSHFVENSYKYQNVVVMSYYDPWRQLRHIIMYVHFVYFLQIL